MRSYVHVAWISKDRDMGQSLKLCSVDLFLLSHIHTHGEVIFSQSDSVCLGLNGVLQVNLKPY